jgi:POT family proton-dependent oligopeptide transporter
MMFAPIPVFWALYNQVNTTWVLQGNHMTPFYFMNSETMQSTGAFLVMIWVPILTMWLYPMAERRGWRPTPLRRMAAGMLLAALSFIIVGLLQTAMDRGATLSIMWQSVPYIVLEAGEVLLSATALEFAFEQAPEGMKSVVMSLWYLVNALGQFLIAAFTKLNEDVVHATGAWTFFFYAVLMLFCSGVFILLATRFHYRGASGAVS